MKIKENIALPVLLFVIIVLVASCKFSGQSKEKHEQSNDKTKMLVAYVAGYRDFDFSTMDVSGITHINYAFANIKDGEVVFDTTKIDNKSLSPKDIVDLQSLKNNNPRLNILVSVGGWGWSGNFSDAALTEQSRLKFAISCANFVKKYKIDGIDLDWEYPNQIGAGNTYRREDIRNFTLMLKAVREELDKIGDEGIDKHYLLTIATGADKVYVENTELGELSQYIDFLNIMTYDFYNGLHNITGHHSNFLPSAQPELDKNNIIDAVDLHINAGFPVNKINLGIPFYGRIWKGVKSKSDQPLFIEAETVGMGIDYIDFAKNINRNGFVRYWDEAAKAPYLWNPEEKIFISYEDEESIQYKIKYLKEKGLGGVMFWEYSADHEKKLLHAVIDNL